MSAALGSPSEYSPLLTTFQKIHIALSTLHRVVTIYHRMVMPMVPLRHLTLKQLIRTLLYETVRKRNTQTWK